MFKKGFISMSLIYAFFIVFLAIMFAVLAEYASNRIFTGRINSEIINEENYKLGNNCSYTINDVIFSESVSGEYKTGTYRVACKGYYYFDLKSMKGEDSDSFNGGAGASANAILYLDKSTVLQYTIGLDYAAITMYVDVDYVTPLKVTSGTSASDTANGEDGESFILDESYILEPNKGVSNSSSSDITIKYLGNVLENE